MRKDTFQCDICGVERGPANHWLVAVPWQMNQPHLSVYRWEDAKEIQAPCVQHLCGQECAHKLLSSYLGNPPL